MMFRFAWPQEPQARFRLGLGIACLGFVADRASKFWLLGPFALAERAPLQVTGFFDLVLVWNRGISYGLFDSDHPLIPWLWFGMGVAICSWLLWLLWQQTRPAGLAGFALVIGGAAGNLYDRAVFGAVMDFIHLHGLGYSWYVFNLADGWISIGIALILYDTLYDTVRSMRTGHLFKGLFKAQRKNKTGDDTTPDV